MSELQAQRIEVIRSLTREIDNLRSYNNALKQINERLSAQIAVSVKQRLTYFVLGMIAGGVIVYALVV